MILDIKDLHSIREKHPGKKIVYVGGCFDLFHAGHVLFLEEAKKLGDILVVDVASDDRVRVNKGAGRPIFNEHMRAKVIQALKPVDYVFFEPVLPQEKHRFEIKHQILKDLRPDIYVINDDSHDIEYLKEVSDKYGVKLMVLPRSSPREYDNVSTSKIIEKLRGTKNGQL